MPTILIIIPYFGKFHNYFNLFLKSIEYNPTIDFLIITDDKRNFSYPKNCKVIYSFFEKEAKKITSYFNFEAKCDSPYKLCDYKPFLGEIYKEYTKKYDFWGWCDTDIILGNIRKFITNDLLMKYDKLYIQGTFSLIKNNGIINELLLHSPVFDTIWHCKEAYSIEKVVHYDEYNGVYPTLSRLGAKVYDYLPDIANIDFRYPNLYLCQWDNLVEFRDEKLIFTFDKGNLFGISETLIQKPFLYIHLQKRKMENSVKNIDSFMIIPNSFLEFDSNFNIENEFLRQNQIKKKEEEDYIQKLYQAYSSTQRQTYYQPKKEVLEILKNHSD